MPEWVVVFRKTTVVSAVYCASLSHFRDYLDRSLSDCVALLAVFCMAGREKRKRKGHQSRHSTSGSWRKPPCSPHAASSEVTIPA